MTDMTLEEKFNFIVDIIQNLPKDGPIKVTNEQKLQFYSFFKQATCGNCNTKQPYFFNVVERAKWDAWNAKKDLSKDQAMEGYLSEMRDVMVKTGASYPEQE